jgi:Fe-S-cluster containining protein
MLAYYFYFCGKVNFTYPKGIRFHCIRCAQCCGDTEKHERRILLLQKEVQKISEAISKPIEYFAIKTNGCQPYLYEMKKKIGDNKCIFLYGNNCTIYTLRPLICRFYPFQLKTTKDGKYKFLYTKECPGIGKGTYLGKKYFKNLLHQTLIQLEEE